jgi:signal transduction histidine kinase
MTIAIDRRVIPRGYPGLAALLFFWTTMGVLAYMRHYLQAGAVDGRIGFELLVWLTCFVPWVAASPVVFLLERRYPLSPSPTLFHVATIALAGVPITYATSLAMVGLNAVLHAWSPHTWTFPQPWWRIPLRELLVQQALYWCSVIGSGIIRRFVDLHQEQQRTARLAVEKAQLQNNLRQAELEVLRMRLNPHFLFNSLQTIGVLAREDPDKASRMLARLGDVLRMCLRRDLQPETTLDSEVELAEAYVAVERVRFSDRLTVSFDVDPQARGASVPTLMLQPLIENAIVHGLRNTQDPGVIVVSAARDRDELVLTVADSGVGPAADDLSQIELGIGLGSTCERLARMYPQRHSVSMSKRPQGGAQVTIVIPFQVAAAATQPAGYG